MTSLAERLRTSSGSIQDILCETNREIFQSPDFQQSMMQPEFISHLHGRLCLKPEGNTIDPLLVRSLSARNVIQIPPSPLSLYD